MQRVYEGTWEEVAAHADELRGQRVTVTVHEEVVSDEIRERIRAFREAIADMHRITAGAPVLPDEAYSTENLYDR